MKNTKLETLLYDFVEDPTDAEKNFQMALHYDGIGHTASAVSFYLRTAERTESKELQYECLLRASMCFSKQGTRGFTVKGLLQHAVSLLPRRPEAYYLLSRYFELEKNDGHWNECFMITSIGENVADFDPSPLRTAIDYPGKYALKFQKALSSWHCGLCDDSRRLFKELLNDPDLTDQFREVTISNLKWMTEKKKENAFEVYEKKKLSKFKYRFSGIEQIEKNYSEAYQDMFVLSMLDGKRNGTYLEIGAGSPFYGNNTVLLEQTFGWRGFSVDIGDFAVSSERKNPCIIKNALEIDYHELLPALGNDIDYLQIDCDPPSVTYDILLAIPFDKFRFRVITFEHDYYADDTKSFREKSREYLRSKGYQLVVSDVAPDEWRNYEDWWVHPEIVDQKTVEKMIDVSEKTKKAEEYFLGK